MPISVDLLKLSGKFISRITAYEPPECGDYMSDKINVDVSFYSRGLIVSHAQTI